MITGKPPQNEMDEIFRLTQLALKEKFRHGFIAGCLVTGLIIAFLIYATLGTI